MRRFITLIDILYEAHTRLFASMTAPPNELYRHAPPVRPLAKRHRVESSRFALTYARVVDGFLLDASIA